MVGTIVLRTAFLFLMGLVAFGCADRTTAPVVPSGLSNETTQQLFVVTNRGRNQEGFFDDTRQNILTYLETTISLPPDREAGDAPHYTRNPDPQKNFAIARQDVLPTEADFANAVRRQLAKRPAQNKEVTVFVHGYHNAYTDSLFRLAQLREDLDVRGVSVSFSWPSAGKILAYNYDRESVLYSRDSLERLIRALPATNPKNLSLVAHSKGSLLLMEALRQIEIKTPGWVSRNVGTVVLIAPDMPVDLFRGIIERINPLPDEFVLFSTQKDKALNISSFINRSDGRLGSIENAQGLSDLPILILDVTNFSLSSNNNHMLLGDSADLIALLREAEKVDAMLDIDTLFGPRSVALDKVSETQPASAN